MSLGVKISKKFKDFALDVEFYNEDGCLGILGASGCGKSMTLKCIAGIETPDSGRIILNGRVLYDSEQNINLSPRERKVGYLFQNYALFPTMTVAENISISLKGKRKQKEQTVQNQIEKFKLDGLEKHYPAQLSGGQQQRVALARIFAYQPEIIMLDEPFSALDSFLKEQLFEQMNETMAMYHGDIMMVSHSHDEIYQFCKKLMIMEDGRFTQIGDTKKVFHYPRTIAAARLIGCKNISKIEQLGARQLYARDWGIKLWTKERISAKIQYVAIHDHDIRIKQDGDQENIYEVAIGQIREEPLAINYFLQSGKKGVGFWLKKRQPLSAETKQLEVVLDKEKLFLLM